MKNRLKCHFCHTNKENYSKQTNNSTNFHVPQEMKNKKDDFTRKIKQDEEFCQFIESNVSIFKDLQNISKLSFLQSKKELLVKKIFTLRREYSIKEIDLKRKRELFLGLTKRKQHLEEDKNNFAVCFTSLKEKEILESSLDSIFSIKSHTLKVLRYLKAKIIFEAFKIESDLYNQNQSHSQGNTNKYILLGSSSILYVPIPNNSEFSDYPVDLSISGILQLARLLESLSIGLNISLLHPINSFDINGPFISPQFDFNKVLSLLPIPHQNTREKLRYFDWGDFENLRIILQSENRSLNEINFVSQFKSSSLPLMQANIIALALSIGVERDKLYPAQAMILNLNKIYEYISSYLRDCLVPCPIEVPIEPISTISQNKPFSDLEQNNEQNLKISNCFNSRYSRGLIFEDDNSIYISNKKDIDESKINISEYDWEFLDPI